VRALNCGYSRLVISELLKVTVNQYGLVAAFERWLIAGRPGSRSNTRNGIAATDFAPPPSLCHQRLNVAALSNAHPAPLVSKFSAAPGTCKLTRLLGTTGRESLSPVRL